MKPLIDAFRADFDRFFTLQKKQILDCPEQLWKAKEAGFYFWQQQFHSVYCISLYALGENDPAPECRLPVEVAMFARETDDWMTKEEVLELAERMEAAAHGFMDSLDESALPLRHGRTSKRMGREMNNLQALVGMIRHCCYHLGCCDSVLRSHGLPGVY